MEVHLGRKTLPETFRGEDHRAKGDDVANTSGKLTGVLPKTTTGVQLEECASEHNQSSFRVAAKR